jgi:hypothetical protein
LSEQVKAFSQDRNLVSVSTFWVITCKAPFANSSYEFRAEECFNVARDDVLRLRKAPSLAFWLIGRHPSAEVTSEHEPKTVKSVESRVTEPVFKTVIVMMCRREQFHPDF